MKFIEDLIAQYQPRLERIGQTATAYADVVTGQLSIIHDELIRIEDQRVFVNELIPATGAPPERVATVPAGQTWVLEVLSLDTTADVNCRLTFNDNFRALDSAFGNELVARPPIRFAGPGDIALTQSAATPVGLFMQFQVLRPRPRRSASAGQIVAGLARYSAERIHAEEHTGIGLAGATSS